MDPSESSPLPPAAPPVDLDAWAGAWAQTLAETPELDDPESNFARYRYGPVARRTPARWVAWERFVGERLPQFVEVAGLLADEPSRAVLWECLRFRALGWPRVRRARQTPAHAALEAALPDACARFPRRGAGLVDAHMRKLPVHEVPELGLVLATSSGFFLNVLRNGQYLPDRPGMPAPAREGDVVLDCGGGWGDTALLFAQRVGATGRVYAFEFTPSNLRVMQVNLGLNRALAGRIRVVGRPLSDAPDQVISYVDDGVGTRVQVGGEAPSTARTVTLDQMVDEEGLHRVDVIKMDIEGAEGAALRGAVRTLRRHRPRLQISAYHRPDDLIRLPALIRAIEPAYRFTLDHHTVHDEETVLYAEVPA